MVENAPVPRTLRVWLAGAILAFGVLFVFVVFQAARMAELDDAAAMDMAQIARNMATGQGFTTDFIRPFSLALAPRVSDHPELLRGPVQPFFMSLLFRAFGPSNQAVSWSSGIPFLLTIPLVFWLGLAAFSRKVGMLSALALAANVFALRVAVSGTEAAMIGLLFTVLCVVLVYHQSRSSWRLPLAVAAGLLTALLYLTNFIWLMAFAPVLLLILLNCTIKQRLPNIVLFVAAFAVVLLPWFFRVYRVTGNPLSNPSAYEMLTNTRTFPGSLIYRSFEESPPGVLSFIVTAPREIYERAHDIGVKVYGDLFTFAGLLIMPFFIVAAIVPLGHAGIDRLRPGLYLIGALMFIALCLSSANVSMLMPLAPIVTVIAMAFFYQLLDLRLRPLTERLRLRWTITAVVLLIGLHFIPLFLQLAPGRPLTSPLGMATRRASQELNALIPQVSGRETAPAAVLSDTPWAIAWYADRPAVWLPRNDVDLRRIEQTIGPIRWLVLTPAVGMVAQQGEPGVAEWALLFEAARRGVKVPGPWRVRQIFANGNWILFERVPDVASTGTLPAAP